MLFLKSENENNNYMSKIYNYLNLRYNNLLSVIHEKYQFKYQQNKN